MISLEICALKKKARSQKTTPCFILRGIGEVRNLAYPGFILILRGIGEVRNLAYPGFILLEDDHLPQGRHLIRLQLVEIETTRYTFTQRIPTIPIRRTTPRGVVTR